MVLVRFSISCAKISQTELHLTPAMCSGVVLIAVVQLLAVKLGVLSLCVRSKPATGGNFSIISRQEVQHPVPESCVQVHMDSCVSHRANLKPLKLATVELLCTLCSLRMQSENVCRRLSAN